MKLERQARARSYVSLGAMLESFNSEEDFKVLLHVTDILK